MKLVKIKLINWHLFSNNTIELKGNTLLSGENGTGKSTLVDAIYYVLSQGDDKSFNHAASQSAKRSLEAYMRFKTGIQNKNYIRNSANVITHIALEYESDINKNHFVIGVVLELSNGNSNPTKHFYLAKDYSINEFDYITNGLVNNHNTLFKNTHFDSWDQYPQKRRKEILAKDVFKLSSCDKYYELLRKAIAFKPIEEVSSFVDDFLLKEKLIDLSDLRSDMRNYNDIHKLVLREEEKINSLSNFIDKAIIYKDNTKLLSYLDIIKLDINVFDYNKQILDYNNQINNINQNIKSNKTKLDSYKNRENTLVNEIYNLEQNDIYRSLKDKEARLSRLKEDISRLKSDIDKYDSYILAEKKVLEASNLESDFYNHFEKRNYIDFNSSIVQYENDLARLKESISDKRSDINYQSKNLDKEIKEVNTKLSILSKGLRSYDSKLIRLINIIKEELMKKYKKDIEVTPFVEYLEIKEDKKEWQNAIEGYLNSQRFDLIIDPIYYEDSIKIYESIKDSENIYSIGIVDIKNITLSKTNENTLFDCLEIVNSNALKYANLLLNNVYCANSLNDLDKHKISITKSAMLYKNYTVRAINKSIYETPYIGLDSIEKQKTQLSNTLNLLNNKKVKCIKDLEKLDNLSNKLNTSKAQILCEMENIWEPYDLKADEESILVKEIEAAKTEKSLLDLDKLVKKAYDELSKLKESIEYLNNQNLNFEREKGSIDTKITDAQNNLNINKELYEKEMVKIKLDDNKFSDYFNTTLEYRNNDNEYNKSKVYSTYSSKKSQNISITNTIINGMQNYSKNFKPELSATLDNLADYIDEYYIIKNRDVVKYKEEALKAYNKCEEGFRTYFLAGIRSNILEAKSEIAHINKSLKRHPFAGETYEFVLEPNKELGDYYRIIMSGEELVNKNLFTNTLNDSDKVLLDDLFNKVSQSETTSDNEKYIQKYLDYREYMRYDIKVTNEAGDVSFISETAREKSGGETQTPFYVVIAACFDELMNKNSKDVESTCLCIFDEAFNNMDEGRIQSVLNFYKELSIQLFIVVPGIRTYSIAPYMDSVIGIAKVNNKAILFHEAGK